MKVQFKAMLAFFLLGLSSIIFYSCDDTPEPASGSINGTVTDAITGQTLQGVKISLSGTAVATTQTGSNGGYSFPNLATGQYRITAELSGFLSNNIDVTVQDGQSMRGDLSMQPIGIEASPSNVIFNANENVKTLQVKATGAGSIDFTASPGRSWMSLTPRNGTLTNQISTITVNVDRSGLGAGTYDGTILFNSDRSSQVVNVTIIVQ